MCAAKTTSMIVERTGNRNAESRLVVIPTARRSADARLIRRLPIVRLVGAEAGGETGVRIDRWNLDLLPARVDVTTVVLGIRGARGNEHDSKHEQRQAHDESYRPTAAAQQYRNRRRNGKAGS